MDVGLVWLDGVEVDVFTHASAGRAPASEPMPAAGLAERAG